MTNMPRQGGPRSPSAKKAWATRTKRARRPKGLGREGTLVHAKANGYIGELMEQPQGLSMVNSNTDCTPYI